MKKFFILFILCFLFVGCAFDTNDSSNGNPTTEYWYNSSSGYLRCARCLCNKISDLEYNVIGIDEYIFYDKSISKSTAFARIKKGYYDNIKPSLTTVSTRTKDTVLNSKKVFHYNGLTPYKIYEIY